LVSTSVPSMSRIAAGGIRDAYPDEHVTKTASTDVHRRSVHP
jgi:hypothetical protein